MTIASAEQRKFVRLLFLDRKGGGTDLFINKSTGPMFVRNGELMTGVKSCHYVSGYKNF